MARVGYAARLLAAHGVKVLAPVIAPYAATRAGVAARHAEAGVDDPYEPPPNPAPRLDAHLEPVRGSAEAL